MRCTSIRVSVVSFFVTLFIAVAARAQMPMSKPAPELAKLDYLAGSWTSDGDMKPGPMGTGGKVTATDDVHWMDGKFFLVMHTKFSGSMGDGTGLAIFGYDAEHKVYTYNAYNSWGEVERATGTVEGDTWTWTSDENFGGQPLKGRYSTKILSPTTYTYKFEVSPDGNQWMTVMDGKATKK
jgi:hypothetical protein